MGILPKKKIRSVDAIVAGSTAIIKELEDTAAFHQAEKQRLREEIDNLENAMLDADTEVGKANRVAINLKAIFDPTPVPVNKQEKVLPFIPDDTGQTTVNPKG